MVLLSALRVIIFAASISFSFVSAGASSIAFASSLEVGSTLVASSDATSTATMGTLGSSAAARDGVLKVNAIKKARPVASDLFNATRDKTFTSYCVSYKR